MVAISNRHSALTGLLSGIAVLLGVVLVGTGSGQEGELGWPREIDDPRARILIYQPQVDSLVQNDLKARAALSVTTPGSEQPVFGAAWIESRISTDRDDRTVTILETKVPRVRFPDAMQQQQEALAAILVENISNQDITFLLDRLLTMLDLAEHQRQAVERLRHHASEDTVCRLPCDPRDDRRRAAARGC